MAHGVCALSPKAKHDLQGRTWLGYLSPGGAGCSSAASLETTNNSSLILLALLPRAAWITELNGKAGLLRSKCVEPNCKGSQKRG